MFEHYTWDPWRHTAIHTHTYIHTHTHIHTFCQSITEPKKMAVGYETSHLSQKKKHDQCMGNS